MGGLVVFVPKEQQDNRCAATPSTVKQLSSHASIIVERCAGEGAGISDKDFEEAGAELRSRDQGLANADVIIAVNPPTTAEIGLMRQGAVWISHMVPQDSLDIINAAQRYGVTLFSMNLIPRISRAQKMDSLSSQSALAGYKAVIMAAAHLGKAFPLQMTAAGTLQPAKVVVLGAGVAGLAAIATAKRLGALVEASDVRPAAKEQVESLGAKFIEVPFDKDVEDKGGYAKAASPEFLKRQAEEVDKRLKTADIVITTALVPGRKAPVLISEEQVESMKKGSVVVDMAAAAGGNCACTKPGNTIEKHGVLIIGEKNIPSTIAVHATELYAKNMLNFVLEIVKSSFIKINKDDEVYREALLVENGHVVNHMVKKLMEGSQ
jgi:NAD(P) transhydrogenase subunit alpha